jgi:FkbM family methyltransferase
VPSGFAKGLWLCADLRYEQGYLNGVHEGLIQEVILRHLQRGGVFYDVGAHIGFFSLLAARAVGEGGEVAAFEADPENAARIREHMDRNALAQVRVFPLAVWSKCCRIHFERASQFSSRNQGAAVQASDTTSGADGIEVGATTLDSHARDRRPPTVIKVDVEGGEAEVLEGAAMIFSEAKPVLVCEVHHSKDADALQKWLRQKGYAPEWLTWASQFPRHLLARPQR